MGQGGRDRVMRGWIPRPGWIHPQQLRPPDGSSAANWVCRSGWTAGAACSKLWPPSLFSESAARVIVTKTSSPQKGRHSYVTEKYRQLGICRWKSHQSLVTLRVTWRHTRVWWCHGRPLGRAY